MSFNKLPTEIMEAIFYIHIYVHLGRRQILFLTCRRWHAVATNFSLLWRNIFCCGIATGSPIAVRCCSLTGLARIIKRTRNATFELTLGALPSAPNVEQFIASVDQNWLSRCRKLTLTKNNEWLYDDNINAVKRIFLSGTFDALECFTWGHRPYSGSRRTFDALLRQFEISALGLRDLTLEHVPESSLHLLGILNRIRKLKIAHRICPTSIWSKVVNAEHLDVYPQLGLYTALNAPRLTSLCLPGRFRPRLLPREGMLRNLTHLVLRFFYTGEHSNATPLSLPSLKYLGIQFEDDVSYGGIIDAENLEELTIVDIAGCSCPSIPLGENVQPRRLRLYLHSSSQFVVQSQPPRVWDKLEELHVTVFSDTWEIPSTVTHMLRAEEKIAPVLRHLTLRHTTHGKGPPSRTQKQTWGLELRDTREQRMMANMARLESIEVGWFPGYIHGYMLGQDSEEWWVTQWAKEDDLVELGDKS